MARRRSRRRKSSYTDQDSSGVPAELVVEDLSPRARRLAESGVIDLSAIVGSGDGGRITSGDILHAARVMEMEQSVARIETVARTPDLNDSEDDADNWIQPGELAAAEPDQTDEPDTDSEASVGADSSSPIEDTPESAEESADSAGDDEASGSVTGAPDPGEGAADSDDPTHFDATTSSAADIGGDVIEVPPNPWDAYNGSSEGLSESALPGAEQSWGEAEANIAAIAEEAAAQVYGRPPASSEPITASVPEAPDVLDAANEELASEDFRAAETVHTAEVEGEAHVEPEAVEPEVAEPETVEPDVAEPEAFEPEAAEPEAGEQEVIEPITEPTIEQPTAVVAALSDIEAAVDPEPVTTDAEAVAVPAASVPAAAETELQPEPREAMMDFGTLELVDPESVWAEGAEDFAPWFLAHSKQLGDVLGLEAGLSEARQFTTKSAKGVLGRDDSGEDVVVVSSQSAVSDDSDLGRALGMAASSGAATVALVSAKFNEDQLKALAWLNNQTKSGVRWYGIEMRVVRIADSPAAMLFDLVASPPNA